MFISHAQTGQDVFLYFLMVRLGFVPFDPAYHGFYVDVGCADPVMDSNSYAFYERGWSGIAVDANPDQQDPFVATRPRDSFVCCGVADQPGTLPFHTYTNPQHNSFLDGRKAKKAEAFVATVDVPVRTLDSILEEHLPSGRQIDFMSLDVEHWELSALRGLDLERFRPRLIVVEAVAALRKVFKREVTLHLQRADYDLVAHTGHDSFFVDCR